MSTDYEIRCACGSSFTRDNWRDPQHVNTLLTLRDAFAAIGKGIPPNFHLDGWDVFGSMFDSLFGFFAEHEGHEMSIYNEYGRRWPECADGQHDMKREWPDYAQCTKCEYDDFTKAAP